MYGVNGKPFLDLVPYLDLSGYKEAYHEIVEYLRLGPPYQRVPFTAQQEIHPANAHATQLGNAVRLVGINGIAADTLERADLAYEEPAAADLPLTMEFLRSLPLKGVGRSSIYFTENGESVPIHRDYAEHPDFNNSFIYLNPMRKPFFIIDDQGYRHIINTVASIFNPADYHGMFPAEGRTFSIRVNGFFTDELIEKAGLAEHFSGR